MAARCHLTQGALCWKLLWTAGMEAGSRIAYWEPALSTG